MKASILFAAVLFVGVSAFATGHACSFYKGVGTAQEEHHVGYSRYSDSAENRAFQKCSEAWSDATCNGGRFRVVCNGAMWGCVYIKSENTAQEVNYPGFGSSRSSAESAALARCTAHYSSSSCESFKLVCLNGTAE